MTEIENIKNKTKLILTTGQAGTKYVLAIAFEGVLDNLQIKMREIS